MIRNTITETRGSIATPFYEFPEGHIDKYKSPLPGSGIRFYDNMATRSLTVWFSTIDEFITLSNIPDVRESSDARLRYNAENYIKLNRAIEYYAPEEYDRYLLENPPVD
jgi:hypothetical protein